MSGAAPSRTPAEVLADIRALHERVHALRDEPQDPLYRIFLDGAEQVLDWLMQSCPDGEITGADPLTGGYEWTLALALSPKAIEDASMGGLYPLIVEKTTP